MSMVQKEGNWSQVPEWVKLLLYWDHSIVSDQQDLDTLGFRQFCIRSRPREPHEGPDTLSLPLYSPSLPLSTPAQNAFSRGALPRTKAQRSSMPCGSVSNLVGD